MTNQTVSATTTIGTLTVSVIEFPTAITLTTNVSDVVDVCHASGIANKVVRLKPMGVVKG